MNMETMVLERLLQKTREVERLEGETNRLNLRIDAMDRQAQELATGWERDCKLLSEKRDQISAKDDTIQRLGRALEDVQKSLMVLHNAATNARLKMKDGEVKRALTAALHASVDQIIPF